MLLAATLPDISVGLAAASGWISREQYGDANAAFKVGR
jgi:hypothetical protein